MDVPVPHVVEIILDVHVPKATDETTEVVKHIPQERVQNCTGEEIVDMPVPQIRKETVEVIQHLPTGRVPRPLDFRGRQCWDDTHESRSVIMFVS